MSIKMLIVFPINEYSQQIIDNFTDDPNYELTIARTIKKAMEKIKKTEYDIIIMDMIFPDGTGLDLKRKIVEIKDIPTIVVSDIRDDMQKILALEYGADDYVVYPVNMLELKARIRAVLRRCISKIGKTEEVEKDSVIVFDQFAFNIVGRKVTFNGKAIDLTGKEFDLLFVLLSHPGKIFSREELAREVWGKSYQGHLRTVDVHIRRLREKICQDKYNPKHIHTKRGEGYYYSLTTLEE